MTIGKSGRIMNVILNPQYAIRNEETCSYLVRRNKVIDNRTDQRFPSVTLLPPFLGYIFNTITDDNRSVDEIAQKLGITREIVMSFITQLIDNSSSVKVKVGGQEFLLPSYLLVPTKLDVKEEYLTIDSFALNEFIPSRPQAPLAVNFMVTTRCTTDCLYCYADRSGKEDLSLEQILRILDEIYYSGVINLALTGGDIFSLHGWDLVLQKSKKLGFSISLSTKTPLPDRQSWLLSECGVSELQFSLDSVVPSILSKMLHVDTGYINRVEKFFYRCSGMGITISVRSVLTKYNASKEDFISLFDFLCNFNNIRSWIITPAFFSEFKSGEDDFGIQNDQLDVLYNAVRRLKAPFPILFNRDGNDTVQKYKTKEDFIDRNKTCLANTYTISVLSSGRCSVCEMLYDNPTFCIGDLRVQTLKSAWNSTKALNLYQRKKDLSEQNNPCNFCSVFDLCKNRMGKKVCYVDVIKVYGKGNDNYPDPRCPHSIDTELRL